MKILTCENLTKSYPKKQVLTDVTLSLEPHKIYGLIGRNGVGKTTLLGILSGQNPASGGKLCYGGAPIWANQASVEEICFSREFTAMTAFGQDARKIKDILKTGEMLFKYWDKAYAHALIVEFDLDIKGRINKMSKGMLSALTIVIALASKAPFTFIDEPVAGLDVFMRDKFYKLLVEEFAQTQRTFVVSTHIIDEVSSIIEDVIILKEGKVLKSENVEVLLDSYRMVSGKAADVDEFCKDYEVLHSEELLNNKTICVKINSIDNFNRDVTKYSFDVSKASLQKLFLQLL